MVMLSKTIAIYTLLCALLVTMAGSAKVLAFDSQPSTSPSPSIQTIQQGIPGHNIDTEQQQQQPSSSSSTSPPAIPQQQQLQGGSAEGVIAHGIIDSLIFTPSATWIATGNWTIGVNNGAVALVTANMTWYNDNGTASHSHELLNFKPIGVGQAQQHPILVRPPDSSVSLIGMVDVGANHRILWKDVQSIIDIKKGGKILSILLNDTQTNHHFGGRPIFGIVSSFTRCSDVPGPNMEMPQPCLNIPIPPQPPIPPPSSVAPSLTTTAPVSPPPPVSSPTIAGNTSLQNPTNFTASSPPSPLLPSGNITSNVTSQSPTFNATGKSPFDILGGG
jgi:hypothetical protein